MELVLMVGVPIVSLILGFVLGLGDRKKLMVDVTNSVTPAIGQLVVAQAQSQALEYANKVCATNGIDFRTMVEEYEDTAKENRTINQVSYGFNLKGN